MFEYSVVKNVKKLWNEGEPISYLNSREKNYETDIFLSGTKKVPQCNMTKY